MSQPSVAPSGASFTAPQRAPSQSQLLRKGVVRTIIETSMCPEELKRGPQGWSFQDFKVQRVLGEGAMSTVVHCVCTRTGQTVAIKMYHKERLNSLNARQVAREITIHASLPHPNVIKLYAAFEDADGIYLVQEFAAGGDLYAELGRHGGYMLEAHVVKHTMVPFLNALCHMHERGILHRDIKPENILLSAQGELKVADFGLAIDTKKEQPMSRVGTLDYMPPEIVALPRPGGPPAPHSPPPIAAAHAASSPRPHTASPLGPKPVSLPGSPNPGVGMSTPSPPQRQKSEGNYGLPADIWCTGVLAYELLVGGPPFEADTKEATYTRILKMEPSLPPHLSPEAKDFITLALRKDPSQRPTVEQLAAHPWLKSHGTRSAAVVASPVAEGAVGPEREIAEEGVQRHNSAVLAAYSSQGEEKERTVAGIGNDVTAAKQGLVQQQASDRAAMASRDGAGAKAATQHPSPVAPFTLPGQKMTQHGSTSGELIAAAYGSRPFETPKSAVAGSVEGDGVAFGTDMHAQTGQEKKSPEHAANLTPRPRARLLSAYLKKLGFGILSGSLKGGEGRRQSRLAASSGAPHV